MADKPRTLQELRIVIILKPGQNSSESSYINDFPNALRRLCGALVEINSNDTVISLICHSGSSYYLKKPNNAMHHF